MEHFYCRNRQRKNIDVLVMTKRKGVSQPSMKFRLYVYIASNKYTLNLLNPTLIMNVN